MLSKHFHSCSDESKPLYDLAFRSEWLDFDFKANFIRHLAKYICCSAGLGNPQRKDYVFQTSCFMNEEIASETLNQSMLMSKLDEIIYRKEPVL